MPTKASFPIHSIQVRGTIKPNIWRNPNSLRMSSGNLRTELQRYTNWFQNLMLVGSTRWTSALNSPAVSDSNQFCILLPTELLHNFGSAPPLKLVTTMGPGLFLGQGPAKFMPPLGTRSSESNFGTGSRSRERVICECGAFLSELSSKNFLYYKGFTMIRPFMCQTTLHSSRIRICSGTRTEFPANPQPTIVPQDHEKE